MAEGLVERVLAAERQRWALWAPVGLGIGIGVYFALPAEPPAWVGPAAVLAAGVPAFLLRRRGVAVLALLALLSVALGFAAAQVRTASVAAPMLTREVGPVIITGRVVGVERLAEGARLVLADPLVERLAPEATPGRVRIRLAAKHGVPAAGAMLRLRGVLHPPPAPAEPGAFDFQRHAFFAGIGAVGFALGPPETVEAPPATGWRAVAVAMEGLRERIAARVAAVLPGAAGAITTALLNGEQTGIPSDAMQAMRDSGLAHLLSISGLHIGLVAGLVFFVVRALLALVEPVALNLPIKKIAAAAGLLAAVGYTLVVGAPVPTLRSLLMTGVLMLAVMADRDPLSMRLVAVAAVVVLLILPEALLGASFQMSFAAVVALIAAYEVARGTLVRWRTETGPLGGAALYVAGAALTSVVATLATTPFSLFHFQTISFYGVLANMLAVPLTSFWVMPWGLIVYLLMPLGLEGPAVVAMGWGVSGILWVAGAVAGLPGATALVPAMPVAGLAAVSFGGLWLTLWTRRWRLFGLVGIVLGMASPLLVGRPDVLVSEDGALAAVRTGDGGLSLSTARAEKRTAEAWLRRDGREAAAAAWPKAGRGADGRLACDALGCVYTGAGRSVALLREPEALAEDCAADAVVSRDPVRLCGSGVAVGLWELRREGAHALFLSPGGVRVETVRSARGERPWTISARPSPPASGP